MRWTAREGTEPEPTRRVSRREMLNGAVAQYSGQLQGQLDLLGDTRLLVGSNVQLLEAVYRVAT